MDLRLRRDGQVHGSISITSPRSLASTISIPASIARGAISFGTRSVMPLHLSGIAHQSGAPSIAALSDPGSRSHGRVKSGSEELCAQTANAALVFPHP